MPCRSGRCGFLCTWRDLPFPKNTHQVAARQPFRHRERGMCCAGPGLGLRGREFRLNWRERACSICSSSAVKAFEAKITVACSARTISGLRPLFAPGEGPSAYTTDFGCFLFLVSFPHGFLGMACRWRMRCFSSRTRACFLWPQSASRARLPVFSISTMGAG